jgi:5-methylcytosine-specific restriction endonuclease McrA
MESALTPRERERLRNARRNPLRRAYFREYYARQVAPQRALRWAEAVREVERTWLALPPGPPPERPTRKPKWRPPSTRTFTGGYCQNCGESFVAPCGPGKGDRFCSPRCGKKFYRRRRRRSRPGPVNRIAVFERDRYVCQLCGGVTDEGAVVPWLRAPVLDHVIPLAQGGADTWENVQTAHFYCNSLKRDLADEVFIESFVLWR